MHGIKYDALIENHLMGVKVGRFLSPERRQRSGVPGTRTVSWLLKGREKGTTRAHTRSLSGAFRVSIVSIAPSQSRRSRSREDAAGAIATSFVARDDRRQRPRRTRRRRSIKAAATHSEFLRPSCALSKRDSRIPMRHAAMHSAGDSRAGRVQNWTADGQAPPRAKSRATNRARLRDAQYESFWF